MKQDKEETGNSVTSASISQSGNFILKFEKRTIDYVEFVEADYLLIASGSSQQDDIYLIELSGITFPKVKASLKLESLKKNIPQLTQVGPMLVTHWGLSGPVILRLSAWGARMIFLILFIKARTLLVDFSPDLSNGDIKALLSQHKKQFPKQKVGGSYPQEFGIMKRFWKYLLNHEGIDEDILWASISNNSLMSIATLLKQCSFLVKGKDEFVTAGGVPLSEAWFKHILLLALWSLVGASLRYSFFGTKEAFGSTPYWLLWLRYSTFLVLYPTGISSEIAMIYNALPYMKESEKYSMYNLGGKSSVLI
ncbi:hypothetical protein Lser_V15G36212 [Lactuca serriola]